jgi:hypothetical protein
MREPGSFSEVVFNMVWDLRKSGYAESILEGYCRKLRKGTVCYASSSFWYHCSAAFKGKIYVFESLFYEKDGGTDRFKLSKRWSFNTALRLA